MNMLVNEDGRLWPRVVAAAIPAGVSLTISIAAFAIMFWSESKTVDAKTADAITRIERRIDTVENEAREARRAAAEDRQKIAEMMAELRSPLEPWRTWFAAAGLDWGEPREGSQFNDVGLMCDAAAAGMGVAPVRLKLGAPWLERGTLVRLFDAVVASPYAHYLCWKTGTMERWECAAFAEWLRRAMV